MSDLTFKTKKVNGNNYSFRVFNASGVVGTMLCERTAQLKILALTRELDDISWVVHELEVKEKYRYQGIGTQLLKYGISQMEGKANIPMVLVPAHEGMNTLTLLHWFKKHGFHPCPTKHYWIRQETNSQSPQSPQSPKLITAK